MWPFKKKKTISKVDQASPTQISMFDRVRIRDAEVTRTLGIAGQVGTVTGETIPSSSGAQMSGPCEGDFAFAIMIAGRKETYWLAPEFVEIVDHGPGTRIVVGNLKMTRDASGRWIEERI